MDGLEARIPTPNTEEDAQRQLESAMLVSQHEVIMPYPDFLMDPNDDSGAITLKEQQAATLEEYYKKMSKGERETCGRHARSW